jgi:uncharacterized DUF497 family protein
METQFAWDEQKASNNIRKHGVSFEEAQTVFSNPLAVIFDDKIHSNVERREIIIGFSARNRLILVCFSERNNVVRIISARCATPKERRDYEQGTSY